mgnify:CR=1 FL=1|tara:strand:+ start:144 stop:1019 length:876 start_codon:yes stop_codon:yes gene_type:complete
MKTLKCVGLLAAILAGSPSFAAPERVGDFNLLDETGTAHQLRKYGYQKALVVISQANSCSTSQELYSEYKILDTKYDNEQVSFVMMNSSINDDVDAVRSFKNSYNPGMPILIDDTQLVAESLGITKAGEIVVLDPNTMTILYRGPLDTPGTRAEPGTTFLKGVFEAIVAGDIGRDTETVTVDFEAAPGCDLEFPAKVTSADDVPDYETEVAPVLIENCVGCHIEGGIGPFAMNSHQMVQGWSPMMREVIMTKRMPPMQVDPSIRSFENARTLSVEDTQTLIHWINAGAPRE